VRTARKLTAVAASAALIGAGSLLAAAPAHASTSPTCTGSAGTVATLTVNSETFSPGAACQYVEFAVGSGISVSDVTVSINGGPGIDVDTTEGITGGTDVVTFNYSGAASGPVGITFYSESGGFPADNYDYIVLVSGGGGGGGDGSSSSSSAGSAPAPVIQQFGKLASATCEEAAPADLNLAGVGSGGWGESWAQWMNGGSGGAVCTRTLSYVGSGWTVS